MAIVEYKITVGSNTFKSSDTVVKELSVKHTLSTPVGSAELLLAPSDKTTVKVDDPVVVELGADSKTKKVFTGLVRSVGHSIEGLSVYATSSSEALTRMYVDTVFENKSCGAIAKDLIGKYEATAGTSEDGITFPRYIISSNRSVWKHIKVLARYSGFDAYTDVEDKFHFKKYAKAPGQAFNFGENVLEVEKEERKPLIDGVLVFGDSPAGQGQSDEANFWMKKTEVKGTAGKTSGAISTLSVFAARNKDLCDQVAKNIFDSSQLISTGRALLLNGESVALGQTISVKKMPNKSLDGDYKVTSIHHLLNSKAGYTTEITWEELQ